MYYADITPVTRLPRSVEQVFTYHSAEKINSGQLVLVNFHGRRLIGVIKNIHQDKPSFKTNPIIKSLPYCLTKQQMFLASLLVELFASSEALAYNTIIPSLKRETTHELPSISPSSNQPSDKLFSTLWGNLPNPTDPYVKKIIDGSSPQNQTLLLIPDQISLEAVARLYPSASIWDTSNSGNSTISWVDSYTASLVIGTKQAIFAPLPNLSNIVVIDSSSELYRSRDAQPKYHTITLVKELALKFNVQLTLFQSFPTLQESTGTFLAKRENNFAELSIIDRHGYGYDDKHAVLSSELIKEIRNALGRVIVYANKRGYAALHCTECELTIRCQICDLPVTSDKPDATDSICRGCGSTLNIPVNCPSCNQTTLKHIGFGIRRIKETIKLQIPEKPVCEVDADKTKNNSTFIQLLKTAPPNAIIVCTSAILPRLWLVPNVDLVVLPRADQHLSVANWRCNEMFLSLMYSFLSKAKQEVILELSETKQVTIDSLKNGDFTAFWKQERDARQRQFYPPYGNIVHISNSDDIKNFTNESEIKTLPLSNNTFLLRTKNLNREIWSKLSDKAKVDVNPYSIV